MVNEALSSVQDDQERESLIALQSELKELIQLTQESLDTLVVKENASNSEKTPAVAEVVEKTELDDEYALFMVRYYKKNCGFVLGFLNKDSI